MMYNYPQRKDKLLKSKIIDIINDEQLEYYRKRGKVFNRLISFGFNYKDASLKLDELLYDVNKERKKHYTNGVRVIKY